MARVFVALCASVLALGGCAPDGFTYDDTLPGGGGSDSEDNCDNDGCPPECPLGMQLTPAGVCEPVCGPFRTSLDIPLPVGLAVDDRHVIAAGTSSPFDGRPAGAQFLGTDACRGATVTGVVPIKGSESKAVGAAFVGDALFVAGWQPAATDSSGFLVELEADSLRLVATTPLVVPGENLELADVASEAGGVWALGQVGSGASAAPWLARYAPGTSPCGAALSSAGKARAVAADQTGAVIALAKDSAVELVRIEAGACAQPSCACQPTGTPINVAFPGATTTRANDLALANGIALVIGDASIEGPPFGYVLAIDLGTGLVSGSFRWDPSPASDALFAAATDGQTLFAGGMSDAQAFDNPADGRGALVALELPLASEATVKWSALALEPTRVLAVQTTPPLDAGVFAAGTLGNGRSLLARCSKEGC